MKNEKRTPEQEALVKRAIEYLSSAGYKVKPETVAKMPLKERHFENLQELASAISFYNIDFK